MPFHKDSLPIISGTNGRTTTGFSFVISDLEKIAVPHSAEARARTPFEAAHLKREYILNMLQSPGIVVARDTQPIIGNEYARKPSDLSEIRNSLRLLACQKELVIVTHTAIGTPQGNEGATDRTILYFNESIARLATQSGQDEYLETAHRILGDKMFNLPVAATEVLVKLGYVTAAKAGDQIVRFPMERGANYAKELSRVLAVPLIGLVPSALQKIDPRLPNAQDMYRKWEKHSVLRTVVDKTMSLVIR